MPITDAAHTKHAMLFGSHTSSLARTDPEFVEVFDNFAFDEVASRSLLPVQLRLEVTLAALIALGAVAEYRVMLCAALNVGVTPVEVKEVVHHAVPYCGQARVFDFLHATNDVLTERGIELPLEAQSTTTPATRREAGFALQTAIFGDRIQAGYDNAPADEVHLHEFLSANCFGDTWTRGGLDVPTRELLTCAMLSALGGCESQLKGHITGNANVGNGRVVLIDVATQLLPWIGYPRTLNALACVREVLPPA